MENWKIIESHPQYQVSDLGRIKRNEKLIKPYIMNKYLKVSLSLNGKVTKHYVHRLVACAFCIKSKDNQNDVAHFNGNPSDNRSINLRWATRSENMMDAMRHGTLANGEKNGQAKITKYDVIKMRERRSRGETFQSIANDYPVCRQTVQDAIHGINWSHIQ